MTKRVFLGGDLQGKEMKEKLKKFFQEENIDFVDLGLFSEDSSSYQDIEREVNEKVNAEDGYGVLIFSKQK
jgi:ribose 5-phosphate isomerase RpiB